MQRDLQALVFRRGAGSEAAPRAEPGQLTRAMAWVAAGVRPPLVPAVRLGQPATTLSGGEAQRIKLASELGKRSTGRTFYILDEPTTGLHFEDIRRLLQVLQRLVDNGNTVLVIENNLDVIKSVDDVIDLGPEGGFGGGQIVAEGTPEQVAEVGESYTGKFLREVL